MSILSYWCMFCTLNIHEQEETFRFLVSSNLKDKHVDACDDLWVCFDDSLWLKRILIYLSNYIAFRFEMPFNIWCGGCNSMIAKGVRFNAEKKQVGNYYSTKVCWSWLPKHLVFLMATVAKIIVLFCYLCYNDNGNIEAPAHIQSYLSLYMRFNFDPLIV